LSIDHRFDLGVVFRDIVAGDDRQSVAERMQDAQPDVHRVAEQCRAEHPGGQFLLLVDGAGEDDVIVQARALRMVLQCVAVWTVSDDHQLGGRPISPQVRQAVDHHLHPILGQQA